MSDKLNCKGPDIVGIDPDGVPVAMVKARPALDFSAEYGTSSPGRYPVYRGKKALGIVAPQYAGDRLFHG